MTSGSTLTGVAVVVTLLGAPAVAEDLKLPRQKIELVAPPFVHPHEQVATGGPKIYEVRLVAEEKQMVIDDDGTTLQAMTFNGTIPAPAIVIHEGDYLEVTLASLASNTMPHNIDFHAATGAQGGGDLTLISPGEQAVFRWKATRTGVFIYHCIPGGPMIPWHIASGMSGVVMVLPRDGLKDGKGKPLHYDRVYYIGEQDFYVPRDEKGKFKTYASHADAFADTLDTMHKLVPSHVVVNGRVDALTGKDALVAKVGENVLFIHSQADRDSRIHIVGGHGDYVWETGKFSNPPQTDGETWFVRGGSAAAVLYRFLQPGIYPYVNHNMTEALELGAFAHIKVEGKWDNKLMTQVKAPAPTMAAPVAAPAAAAPEAAKATPGKSAADGARDVEPTPVPGGPVKVTVTPAAAGGAPSADKLASAAPKRHVHRRAQPPSQQEDPSLLQSWLQRIGILAHNTPADANRQ
jgi:nitrite reductase (NO-forming)